MIVTITNGVETKRVSKGAFKAFFEPLGYSLSSDFRADTASNDKLYHDTDKEGESSDLPPLAPQDEPDVFEDVESDDIEIPLSEMTKNQLIEYADAHGIDISGVKTKDEIRQVIMSMEA